MKLGLVDDDLHFVNGFKRDCAKEHAVLVFSDLSSAVRHSDSLFHCDAILIDIHLPDGSGYSLLEQLRAQAKPMPPVLFFTEDQSNDTRLLGLRMGASDFLLKSMGMDEIGLRIRNSVDNRRSARVLRRGNMSVSLENFRCEFDTTPNPSDSENHDLTKIELLILFSILGEGDAPSRQDLEYTLWPDTVTVSNTLNSHISNLNKKLCRWDHVVRVSRTGLVQVVPRL